MKTLKTICQNIKTKKKKITEYFTGYIISKIKLIHDLVRISRSFDKLR